MKAHILKIAGVKDENEFYKKFPTEESFMAKHGKALKKAQFGDILGAVGGAMGQAGGKTGAIGSAVGAVGGLIGNGAGGGLSEGAMDAIGGGVQAIGGAVQGAKALKAEKEALNAAKQMEQVTSLSLQAQESDRGAEEIAMRREQQYVRPEDNIVNGEELFPINGVGTNILARRGMNLDNSYSYARQPRYRGKQSKAYKKIRKAQTGTNMNWGQIAQGVGQVVDSFGNATNNNQPIGGVNQVTAHTSPQSMFPTTGSTGASGGGNGSTTTTTEETTQQSKFNKFMAGDGANAMNQISAAMTGKSGGAQIGGAVADAVKMIPGVGTAVGAIAGPALEFLGDKLLSQKNRRATERAQANTERNTTNMSGISVGNEINQRNSAFAQYGTNMDQGGSDVRPLWGGRVEPHSYNPHAPGDGITEILRGQSHEESSNGRAGIGLEYEGNMVEAERGEPIVETQDSSKHIMGDLPLPKGFSKAITEFTGEKIKGGKFKTFIKNLGELENKQNKLIEKNVLKANDLNPYNKHDRITLDTLKRNEEQIYHPKLQALQQAKEGAAMVQEQINQAAEMYGLDSPSLAKGNVIQSKHSPGYARNGFKFAEEGTEMSTDPKKVSKEEAEENVRKGIWVKKGDKYIKPAIPGQTVSTEVLVEEGKPGSTRKTKESVKIGDAPITKEKATNMPNYYKGLSKRFDGASGEALADAGYIGRDKIDEYNQTVGWKETEEVIPATEDIWETETETIEGRPEEVYYVDGEEPKSEYPWGALANQMGGWFRDTDAEAFDNRQIIPELSAMASNQLQPVDAQKYHPLLDVPYDISFQDGRNDIISATRGAERLAAYNPGLAGNIKAQEYDALNSNRGEEFRQNQAMKHGVYSNNRAILNDANMKNLGIMDNQYVRQAQAKTNTENRRLAALSSISDKKAKHRLENRQLATWENMYDFRFDPNYRARYQGPWQAFDDWRTGAMGPTSQQSSQGADSEKKRAQAGGTPGYAYAKNGRILKAYKKY